MKIWAVVPGFSRTLDDASIPALRELLLAWARAGDEVEVLALRVLADRVEHGEAVPQLEQFFSAA